MSKTATNSPKGSPPRHPVALKSNLGRAIEIKRKEKAIDYKSNHSSHFKQAVERQYFQANGEFNDKSNKNLAFLPFIRERNGVGKLIESVPIL